MSVPGEFASVQSDGQLVPLSEQQRDSFPHVIFEYGFGYELDEAAFKAAVLAAQHAGLPVVADIERDQATGFEQATVRSATTDRFDLKAESALIQGATSVAARSVEFRETADTDTALTAAEAAVRQITDNESLSEAFKNYYAGLRWSTDQEKFIPVLFRQATELDMDQLDSQLSGNKIVELVHAAEIDIPYEERRDWYELTPDQIFEQKPELDYRKLRDPEFLQSQEGQALAENYRQLCGSMLADNYKRYPRPVTDEGMELPKPIIPLTSYPLVEALMIDEVSTNGPKAKYDFGASEVIGLVLDSDSAAVQHALVESLTTRLPREQRHVFDGPNEFDHKRRVLHAVLRVYEASVTPQRREEFKQRLLTVLDAYTGHGAIASEIRSEHHRTAKADYQPWETGQVKEIVKDILTVGLASPDADEFVGRYMHTTGSEVVTGSDPLELDNADKMLIMFDALGRIDPDSHPALFRQFAHEVFEDEETARTFGEIAELRREAAGLWRSPQLLLARKALQRATAVTDDKPEARAARADYDQKAEPAEALFGEARTKTNKLIIEYLTHILDEAGAQRGPEQKIFEGLVNRISFVDTYKATNLPAEYADLIQLAEHPAATDRQRGKILWHIAEKFEYGGELQPYLVSMVLDGFRTVLGEPESLRVPSDDSSHALAAVVHLATNNPALFKFAAEEQLQQLERYKNGIVSMAERVMNGSITSDTDNATIEQPYGEEQDAQENLRRVAGQFGQLEELYSEFLHIEDVKIHPHIYYPWLMKQMTPFWRKMQWEVGPGNQPSPEIKGLHDMLADHIKHKLDLREGSYPEEFDVFEEGSLGSLLLECHKRMLMNHEIQYNTTVWQDGLSFMHYAAAYMPQSVFDKFKARYGGHTAFISYLENARRP